MRFWPRHYPQHTSALWKILQIVLFLGASVLFLLGSVLSLYPEQIYIGRLLILIGAAMYLWGNIREWLHNQRVGCCDTETEREDFERFHGFALASSASLLGIMQRLYTGVVYTISVLSSAAVFAGSVAFVQNENRAGAMLFIIGSAGFLLANSLKLIKITARYVASPETIMRPRRLLMAFVECLSELLALTGALLYVMGGAKYLLGSTRTAVVLWIIGSAFFVANALAYASIKFCVDTPILPQYE